jgi:hypothetical protein
MENFYIILAKTDLSVIKTRMEISLKDIQEKAPEKKEYIHGLSESIDQIKWISHVINDLDSDNKQLRLRNYDLELMNLKLIDENKKLNIDMKIQEQIKKSDL